MFHSDGLWDRICSPTACAYVPLVSRAWKTQEVLQLISDVQSGQREGEEGGDGLCVPPELNHIRPNMCDSLFNLECPTFVYLCLKFVPHLSIICGLLLAISQLNLQKTKLACMLLQSSYVVFSSWIDCHWRWLYCSLLDDRFSLLVCGISFQNDECREESLRFDSERLTLNADIQQWFLKVLYPANILIGYDFLQFLLKIFFWGRGGIKTMKWVQGIQNASLWVFLLSSQCSQKYSSDAVSAQ